MLENSHPMCDAPSKKDVEIQGTRRLLARCFVALSALTSSLIVLGALVRVQEAGLACPDWPLCFGEVIPQMNLQIGFEWTHRVVAGGVAFIFTTLAVLTWRRPFLRKLVARWLLTASTLLVLQILLGALTVWKLLAPWTVTSHLLTGNAFNATLTICALRLFRNSDTVLPRISRSIRTATLAVGSLLLIQIALGGWVASNSAGLACPLWPTCNGDSFAPSLTGSVGIHLLHRWNAALLIAVAGWATWSARGTRLFPMLGLGLALCLCEAIVGIGNVLFGIPIGLTALHSAMAAGLVLCFSLAIHDAYC